MNMTRKCVLGLPLLCLPLWLTACAPAPIVKTQTAEVKVPVYVALPSELTSDCPMPAFPDALTNGTLVDYTLSLQACLRTDIDKLGKIRALQVGGN